MSNAFERAFSATMQREGGYVLHKVENDRGGTTYAGIARNFHPSWPGWRHIDDGVTPPTELVREFYRREFWNRLNCDLMPPRIAASVFDFGVNAGTRTAAMLAQIVAGVEADGIIGPKSAAAMQAMDPQMFEAAYALAKVRRYTEIVTRDRTQQKFLLGWLNRTLGALT
jgi:lysozyme family protein